MVLQMKLFMGAYGVCYQRVAVSKEERGVVCNGCLDTRTAFAV